MEYFLRFGARSFVDIVLQVSYKVACLGKHGREINAVLRTCPHQRIKLLRYWEVLSGVLYMRALFAGSYLELWSIF